MDHQPDDFFESIESAYEYIKLLAEVASDAKKDLDTDISAEEHSPFPRQLDAMRLASYNLEKLHLHVSTTSRILNDLRSIRRLLLHERKAEMLTSTTSDRTV